MSNAAQHSLDRGHEMPFDLDDYASRGGEATSWQHAAARGVIAHLTCPGSPARKDLLQLDTDQRAHLMSALTEIIAAAAPVIKVPAVSVSQSLSFATAALIEIRSICAGTYRDRPYTALSAISTVAGQGLR